MWYERNFWAMLIRLAAVFGSVASFADARCFIAWSQLRGKSEIIVWYYGTPART